MTRKADAGCAHVQGHPKNWKEQEVKLRKEKMENNLGAKVFFYVCTKELHTECSPNDGEQVAETARNHDGPMQATSGGDVGSSGASLTVPGQVELDPGATPQAQLQVKGTAPTTQSPRTN